VSILDKLRNKPEPYRRTAGFLVSLFITLIISIIWFSSFSGKNEEANAHQSEGISFSFISQSINDFASIIVERLEIMKENIGF